MANDLSPTLRNRGIGARRLFESFRTMLSSAGHFRTALTISLALLFLASFAVPLVFASKVKDIFFGDGPVATQRLKLEFPQNSGVFSDSKYFLRIRDAEGLDPRRDEDFMVLSWYSLKLLPQLDERKVLYSKLDPSSPTQRGYSLSLVKIKEGLQPVVYWRDNSGRGGALKFAPIELLPKTWFMFALTCRKNRFLGLHGMLLRNEGKPEIKLLGGYDLEDVVAPWSDSDLVVGPFNSRRVEGKVGPFGIFSGPKLLNSIDDILHDLRTEPGQLPKSIPESAVKIWRVPTKDDSNQGADSDQGQIEFKVPDRRKR